MSDAKPMTDEEMRHFIDTVAAVALANHGIVACMLAGVAPTMENVIPVVGRFVDPSSPRFEEMALSVEAWRAAAIEAAKSLSLDIRR